MANKDIGSVEFHSDDEVQEMLDAMIAAVGTAIMEDESQPSLLVPLKIQQMQFAYGLARYLTRSTAGKVSYKLHEPFNSMGSISIEGKRLYFENSEWFSRLAEFANNTEVYPLADGRVRMTFTFHGLTRPVQ